MRRAVASSALVAALLVLPGCQWLLAPALLGEPARTAEEQAQADIRGAIPAIEAFYADNNTYAGITVTSLRTTYDSAVPDVRIVVTGPETYCVESEVGGLTYFKPRRGDVRPGSCPPPPPGAPSSGPSASDQLRTVVAVMEARLAQTGSFAVTPQWLGSRIPGLRPVRVVEAGPQGYCIEMTGEAHTYAARGPVGDVAVGRC